jgi:nucleoid DNA-binding protein
MIQGWTMIRSELVQSLTQANAGLTSREVDRIVELFFDTIVERLAANGRVELRGFGAFSIPELAMQSKSTQNVFLISNPARKSAFA